MSGLETSAGEGIGYPLQYSWTFLVTQTVKNPPISTCSAGELGSTPVLGKSPGEREQFPTPVLWPGEFHGQSLADCSPWGCKEFGTTE